MPGKSEQKYSPNGGWLHGDFHPTVIYHAKPLGFQTQHKRAGNWTQKPYTKDQPDHLV